MRPALRAGRLLTACVALGLMVGACAPSRPQSNSLRYGLTLSPTGIDPHLNASAELGIPLSSVYDTLVFLDRDTGEFVPGLATGWTISEDGLTYTFTLRRDVRFHDGSAFDAEAVRVNIEYTLDPDHHSQKAASMLGPLQEVEVLDEYTVAFDLGQPFAPLLDSLSQVYLGMASPSALQTWGPGEYQFHQIGTGPYRFVEYVANDHLTLARNPDYAWAPSVYHQAEASIETITFLIYEDAATRALALENGEVDVMGEIPPLDAARLVQSGDFRLNAVPIPGQPLQYFFNTTRPPTDNLLVRRALVMATNRPQIVGTVFGEYSPVAEGPLSTTTLGFAPDLPFPAYNHQAAGALLDEAGWADEDGDGLRTHNGQALSLLLVVPTWGSNPEVAQLLEAAWEALGAQVTLQMAAGFGPLREMQAADEYNIIGINFFGTDPDLLRPFFASDGFYNWAHLNDPMIDEWLAGAAQMSLDGPGRMDLYRRFAQRVRDQAVLLPVRDYVNLVVSSLHVQGLRFSGQGWFPYLIELRLTR